MTWEQYKVQFKKRYSSQQEEAFRRAVFEKTKKDLETDECSACGVNKFSDITQS